MWWKILLIVLILILIGWAATMTILSATAGRPDNLGVHEGRLAPCPDTPNCVSSQADDEAHKMDPIPFDGDAVEALARLEAVVESQPRTTIISADGDYLGGAIAPGVEISLDAHVSHTAMLRRVEPVAPDSVIGRNTVASIQSGLVWGFVAQVEGMVARMVAELGGSAKVVATGGQAALVAGLTNVIQATDPLLTLDGLRLIYAQNADGRPA